MILRVEVLAEVELGVLSDLSWEMGPRSDFGMLCGAER
jgi:hypothetical protein